MIKRIWDITLTVSDLKRSVEFYEKTLGLQKKYEFNDYAGFDCGGVEIGLKTWGEREKPRKGEPCIDFLVDNVDDFVELISRKGVRIIKKPEDSLWGSRFAIITDPDGHEIQISQVYWDKYFAVCAPK